MGSLALVLRYVGVEHVSLSRVGGPPILRRHIKVSNHRLVFEDSKRTE